MTQIWALMSLDDSDPKLHKACSSTEKFLRRVRFPRAHQNSSLRKFQVGSNSVDQIQHFWLNLGLLSEICPVQSYLYWSKRHQWCLPKQFQSILGGLKWCWRGSTKRVTGFLEVFSPEKSFLFCSFPLLYAKNSSLANFWVVSKFVEGLQHFGLM